jgi:hypothetical protein
MFINSGTDGNSPVKERTYLKFMERKILNWRMKAAHSAVAIQTTPTTSYLAVANLDS